MMAERAEMSISALFLYANDVLVDEVARLISGLQKAFRAVC